MACFKVNIDDELGITVTRFKPNKASRWGRGGSNKTSSRQLSGATQKEHKNYGKKIKINIYT